MTERNKLICAARGCDGCSVCADGGKGEADKPICPHCGLTDIEYSRTCHNSACSAYAREESFYRGWQDTAPQAIGKGEAVQNVMNIPLDAAAAMADYTPQAECAPREAQPNWKALHAAADAVAASAGIWAGFSTQDAKVCVDAYLAAPTPERAQESAGVLTDDQIREIWMRETGTTEQDSPLAILDFARAVLAKKEGA
jgi:hypothetical protein